MRSVLNLPLSRGAGDYSRDNERDGRATILPNTSLPPIQHRDMRRYEKVIPYKNPLFTPVHPLEIIKDELEVRGLTKSDLARWLWMDESCVEEVIMKLGISRLMAYTLEQYLGIPSDFWLNMQKQYDAETRRTNQEA